MKNLTVLFSQISLKIINVGTKQIQKHIFYEKFFIKFLKKIYFYNGFMPTFMILREFGENKFFLKMAKKKFFRHTPLHGQKIFTKNFFEKIFFQISFKIINVGTKPSQKHIFFKNFFMKIFRNQPTKSTTRKVSMMILCLHL